MSKGLKIFLGVLLAVIVVGAGIYVVGGDSLLGRFRYRSVKPMADKIVNVQLAEHECPESPKLVFARMYPPPSGADSVEVATFDELYDMIVEEMQNNDYKTECPYLIDYYPVENGGVSFDGKVKCAVNQMKFGANELGCTQVVGEFGSSDYFNLNVGLSNQGFVVRNSYLGDFGEFELEVDGGDFNVWRVSE